MRRRPDILNMVKSGYSLDGILKHRSVAATLSEFLLDRHNARMLAEELARSQFPHHAHRILVLAYKLGCRLKQNAYQCVAYELAQARRWHLISPVVSLGIKQSGRTTVRLLNWKARAYVEENDYGALAGILAEFERHKLKPNQRTFLLLISGHIRNRDLTSAKAYLQRMEEAGFRVDAFTHALVASVYRSLGPDPEVQARALETLRDGGKSVALTVLNSLLRLRLDANDIPGALDVLSHFKPTWGDAAFSLGSGEDSTQRGGDKSLSLKRPLSWNPPPTSESTRVPFDSTTYLTLINHMLEQQNATQALDIFTQMIAAGIRPDAGSLATLVRIYFAMGEKDAAVCVVKKMCDDGYVSRLCKLLLSKVGRGRDLSFIPKSVPPTIEIFNAFFSGVLSTCGLDGADVVLRIMWTTGVRPDAQTTDILVMHLCKRERADPRTLLLALRDTHSPSVPPTLRQMHSLLNATLRCEKLKSPGHGWNVRAVKFARAHRNRRHSLEESTTPSSGEIDPVAGIELPRVLSTHTVLYPILRSLASRRIRGDKATMSLRIRYDAVHKADLESAKAAFQSMLAQGMHPNEYHFSALMEGYARQGDLEEAGIVLDSARRAGIEPNVVMFTILIVGYARRGDPGSAMRVFREMLAAGVQPDVPAVDAVASAYYIVGRYTTAKNVLVGLWSYVQPFPESFRSASLRQLACAFRALHRSKHPPQRFLKTEESVALREKLQSLVQVWKLARRSRRRSRFRVRLRRTTAIGHIVSQSTKRRTAALAH
jgi:pentatricopeptide repeat protein